MLTECPTCHQTDGIYIAGGAMVGFDGKERRQGARKLAYCGNIDCKQTFWWYSKAGRIVHRNIGPGTRSYL